MKNEKLQNIFKIVSENNVVKIKTTKEETLGIIQAVMLKFDNEHTQIIFECYQDARDQANQTQAPQGMTIKQILDIISNVDNEEEIYITLNHFYHWDVKNAFVNVEKNYYINHVEFQSNDEDMLILVLDKKEYTNKVAA